MTTLPSVTVIVPFFNPGELFERLLKSLAALKYPEELLEVLLVDNGCSDGSPDLAASYPFTVLPFHTVNNSYAARNAAIRSAKGEILAFTDADCVVDPQWVRNGAECIGEHTADLVGGRIRFTFPGGGTPAEYFDALTHMQNRVLIERQDSAVTANLFVRKDTFAAIGDFPEDARSGGDRRWTQRATSRGMHLVYCSGVVVFHPARRFTELLKKAWRVGGGYAGQTSSSTPSYASMIRRIARSLRPGSPAWIRGLIDTRGEPEMSKKVLPILIVAYIYGLVWAVGALRSVAIEMVKQKGRR